MQKILIESSALEYLKGKETVLRITGMAGCGGACSLIPTVQEGTPKRPDDYEFFTVNGYDVYIFKPLVHKANESISIYLDTNFKMPMLAVKGFYKEKNTCN